MSFRMADMYFDPQPSDMSLWFCRDKPDRVASVRTPEGKLNYHMKCVDIIPI